MRLPCDSVPPRRIDGVGAVSDQASFLCYFGPLIYCRQSRDAPPSAMIDLAMGEKKRLRPGHVSAPCIRRLAICDSACSISLGFGIDDKSTTRPCGRVPPPVTLRVDAGCGRVVSASAAMWRSPGVDLHAEYPAACHLARWRGCSLLLCCRWAGPASAPVLTPTVSSVTRNDRNAWSSPAALTELQHPRRKK